MNTPQPGLDSDITEGDKLAFNKSGILDNNEKIHIRPTRNSQTINSSEVMYDVLFLDLDSSNQSIKRKNEIISDAKSQLKSNHPYRTMKLVNNTSHGVKIKLTTE